MNKDTVVASIIGFGLGLVAAIALWVVPRVLPKTSSTTANPSPVQVVESATTANDNGLTITTPQDGEITTQAVAKISGKGSSLTRVIVSTSRETAVVETDKTGVFTATIALIEGANAISVVSLEHEKEANMQMTLYYYADGI